ESAAEDRSLPQLQEVLVNGFDRNGEPDSLQPRATIVLIPTTWPLSVTSGPPLLPGLIGASVCRTLCFPSPRTPENTPEVTVYARPCGLPTVYRRSPKARFIECP